MALIRFCNSAVGNLVRCNFLSVVDLLFGYTFSLCQSIREKLTFLLLWLTALQLLKSSDRLGISVWALPLSKRGLGAALRLNFLVFSRYGLFKIVRNFALFIHYSLIKLILNDSPRGSSLLPWRICCRFDCYAVWRTNQTQIFQVSCCRR